MTKQLRIIGFFLLILCAFGALFFFAEPTFAQTDSLEVVGEGAGLQDTDLRIVIARIIRTILGFLGVIAVLIVLWGGFVWMTAGGSPDRVETAKKILINGLIGLAIILLSYSIVTFVLQAITGSLGGGSGSGGGSGGGGSGSICLGGCGSDVTSFQVTDFSPEGEVSIRNIELQITFSRNVDEDSVEGNIVITNTETGEVVDGVIAVRGNRVSFTPSDLCPEPNADLNCFAANTAYTVEVDDAILSTAGSALSCGGESCVSAFTSGEVVDTEGPDIEISFPDSGEDISVDASTLVQVVATDDSEVATVDFLDDDGVLFDSVPAEGDDLSDVVVETTYYTDSLTAGVRYRIEATVRDIAGNTASDSVSIDATAAHCFDDEISGDEEGVDCGGEDCGSCDGSSCSIDDECASGTCLEGLCVAYPEIASVSPGSGAVGTYVTISGSGFGSTAGALYFSDGAGGRVEATVVACSDGWSADEIVVAVPEGAADGPITLITGSGYTDTTDDTEGALIDDFDVNDVVRPNVCDLSPETAEVNDALSLKGANFGTERGEAVVLFTSEDGVEVEAGSYTSWSDDAVSVTIPVVEAGEYYAVSVEVDGVASNALEVGVEDTVTDAPVISTVDPDEGGVGQYVTISGLNFGSLTGNVWFENETFGRAQGSIAFPDACLEDYWSDDEVVIIVPETFTSGEPLVSGSYDLIVESVSDGSSEAVAFTVTDADPTPGICSIDPDEAAIGETVVLHGDNFGTDMGVVEFYDGARVLTSASLDWSNDRISAVVPIDAVTGPVFVEHEEGLESNTVNVAITEETAAEEGTALLGGYSWYFGTGEVPDTPSVVESCSDEAISSVPNDRFTDAVCVNAQIRASFTTRMDVDTLTTETILVERCDDDACDDTTPVETGDPVISSSASATSFTMAHEPFETNTTYKVTILSDVMSEDGVEMDTDTTWTFTTGSDSTDCDVEEVFVSPSSETITRDGGTTEYEALPVVGCQILDASDYAWTWSMGSGSYATVTEGVCEGVSDDACAVVTALAEGEDEVTAREDASSIEDRATVIVNFEDPYVTTTWPSCEEACVNAELGARFNVAMDDAIEDLGMVRLYECSNELCLGLTAVDASASCVDAESCDEITIRVAESSLGGLLKANTYYRVVISGEVTSLSGVPLTETNYGEDYSWTFATQEDSSLCSVSRLEISPDGYTASAIGEMVAYEVQPYGGADSCSTNGQRLVAYNYDYTWEDPYDASGVASWVTIGDSLLDADPSAIPDGCTESCLPSGSDAYAAVCGDGVIGIGEDCDDGNVASGDGCSSTCQAEGSRTCSFTCAASGLSCGDDADCAEVCIVEDGAASGTCSLSEASCTEDADCTYATDTCEASSPGCCGDGVLDYDAVTGAGEECDDGNVEDGDGCSAICINEGSRAAGATCGNGSIGYSADVGGEDCDDGNRSSGDGCSAQCLNEGSTPITSIEATCGNGEIESPYETCDDGNTVSGDGCSSSCLREGIAGDYGTCGNGIVERRADGSGEDCDLEEGCGSDCLWEGASTAYSSPSVCGDGYVGIGEYALCEDASYGATGGDGDLDPMQVAEIVEGAAEVVDIDSGVAETTIEVRYEDVSTTTALYLSCVAETDADCSDGYGPADNACCMARPTATLHPNGDQVCRNAAVYGLFTERMDTSSFFYTESTDGDDREVENMYLVLDEGSAACPASHRLLARPETSTLGVSWVSRLLYKVSALFGTGVIQAQESGDCVVDITGVSQQATEDGLYKVFFHHDTVLEPEATYVIYVLGDEVGDVVVDREGALSASGVEMDGDISQTFTTDTELCSLDEVVVEDVDEDSPGLYTSIGEVHEYAATAYSRQTGSRQAIEPITDVYDWEWTSWLTDDASEEILSQESEDVTDDGAASATFAAAGENGDVDITVSATITTDRISDTVGDSASDTTSATAMVCERPWPSVDTFPFVDDVSGLDVGAERGIGWMNFSTYYCRDAGDEDEISDDLPDANVVLADDTEAEGIIKEYLFQLTDSGESTGDAIGVRIAQNSTYLSPEKWYEAQGFAGSPEAYEVDGYPGIRDGRTVYVAFPNRSAGNLYPNIFIISYNAGASQQTIDIFDQLVENLSFNTNLNDTGLCISESGSFTDSVCSSDQDCNWRGGEVCADEKSKLRRDMHRLVDVTDIVSALETYGDSVGYCSDTIEQSCTVGSDCPGSETCEPGVPQLGAGTFVPSLSTSAWSSWSEALADAVRVDIPVDPLNTYVNCGEGTAHEDYDAETCVNQTTGAYICPFQETHVYHYRSYGVGSYYLGAELEYQAFRWPVSIDQDEDDNTILKISAKPGSGEGFTAPSYFCSDTLWGDAAICGDGVIGGDEVCEIGQALDADTCTVDGAEGSIAQTCASDCLSIIDDPDASCTPYECGNGVIDAGEVCDDGSLNGTYGYCDDSCGYDDAFTCGDGSLAGGEICDCGTDTASGLAYGGSTCTVANGVYNSNPNNTCAWDCAGPASYCGDGVVDAGEQCDGDTDTWSGSLCSGGPDAGKACTSDDDCAPIVSSTSFGYSFDVEVSCGDPEEDWSEACPTTTVCIAGDEDRIGYACDLDAECDSYDEDGVTNRDGVCSTSLFPTTRTITCADDGASGDLCTWNEPWSESSAWEGVPCKAISSCGNGEIDEGEECDDGNSDSSDACTNECQLNVCGDGYVYAGEEQCDEGSDNGVVCDASYGSSCSYCNDRCVKVTYSGAFCGDDVAQDGEVCDGSDVPFWYAQVTEEGAVDPEGAVYGICDPEEEGEAVEDGDITYVCSYVGVCNGGERNALMCTSDADCDDGGDGGVCQFPTCADDCGSICPFSDTTDELLMRTNALGATRSSEIELLSYDTEITGATRTGNAATLYVPACTAATGLTADVSFRFDQPNTRVIFVTDLSASMDRVFDGVCSDSGTSCELDADCGASEVCEGDSRLEIAKEALQTSIDGLFDGLGDQVEAGFIGYIHDGEDYSSTYLTFENAYGLMDADGAFFFSEDDRGYAKTRIALYSAEGGTYTYHGLEAARESFSRYAEGDDRQIVVLLSDGNWKPGDHDEEIDPGLAACQMRDAGIEIYTVGIYSGDMSGVEVDADFCDRYRGDDGDYLTEEEWTEGLCGNGEVDSGEECDPTDPDSYSYPSSQCTSSCTLQYNCCGTYYASAPEEPVCFVDGPLDTMDSTCPSSCSTVCDVDDGSGSGTGDVDTEICGNGICEAGEDVDSCPADCDAGVDTPGTSDGIGELSGDGASRDLLETPRPFAFIHTFWKRVTSAVRIDEVLARTSTGLSYVCGDEYEDMGWRYQMVCWSSGNPNEEEGIDYAFNGDTAEDLLSAYEEIIESITNIQFTYVIDGETSTGQISEGDGVSLPWPEGFACDGESVQELPIRVSFDAADEDGVVQIENVRLNYCAP